MTPVLECWEPARIKQKFVYVLEDQKYTTTRVLNITLWIHYDYSANR